MVWFKFTSFCACTGIELPNFFILKMWCEDRRSLLKIGKAVNFSLFRVVCPQAVPWRKSTTECTNLLSGKTMWSITIAQSPSGRGWRRTLALYLQNYFNFASIPSTFPNQFGLSSNWQLLYTHPWYYSCYVVFLL